MRALEAGLSLLPLFAASGCLAELTGSDFTAGAGAHSAHGQCKGDFTGDDSARQFSTFLSASDAFIVTANGLDKDLLGACRQFGTDLGMSGPDLDRGGAATLAVCSQVTSRLRSEMSSLRGARVKARLETTEPVCTTRVAEYRQCIEKCDTRVVSAGRVEYRCEGGELRGSCTGQCQGSCAAAINGHCEGACEGTCSGSCEGACNGVCAGECSARASDGSCAGSCHGTCRGTCSAGCSGTCEGHCVASAQAACAGECRGGCSVEFHEPVCTGRIVPPEVRTECREMCDSVRVSHQVCTPGQARLVVDATSAVQAGQRAERLGAIIAARMPQIHTFEHRLRQLRDAGEVMVRTSSGFASGIAEVGLGAIACAAQEAVELPQAVSQVSVAFQVSVSFGASVDVSAPR